MAEPLVSRAAASGVATARLSRVGFAMVIAVVASSLAVWKVPASAVEIVTTPAVATTGAVIAPVALHRQPPPRVLLMGDSIMDQQGSAAAFELRQAGIDAKSMGEWGSSLLTRDQYDFGTTNRDGGWLHQAAQQIATFDPKVVAVYLNHNYWPPFPRDADGRTIAGPAGLWSPSGQAMLRSQAAALITILRARGATVFFVAPIPAGTIANPNPDVWSAIWHGYVPVLTAMHVPVIDSGAPLRGPDGLRISARPSCTGAQELIRPPGGLHLTRYGAGLAGTLLAASVAKALGRSLDGNGAPGDRTAALVPVPAGGGYWLVGCEGSVYHFGSAATLPGGRVAIEGHHGVAAAAATPDGQGLWLIATDGTIVALGDAPPLRFRASPASAITAASVTAGGKGIIATTSTGAIETAGSATLDFAGVVSRHRERAIVDIEPTRDDHGYWLVSSAGRVFHFGDAPDFGSMPAGPLDGPIVGMAAAPDDRGYWLAGADGGIFAFGDAKFLGTARWVTPPYPFSLFTATPGPAVDVVAAPGPKPGYWVVGDTGRVTNAGAAAGHAGDNDLALATQ